MSQKDAKKARAAARNIMKKANLKDDESVGNAIESSDLSLSLLGYGLGARERAVRLVCEKLDRTKYGSGNTPNGSNDSNSLGNATPSSDVALEG